MCRKWLILLQLLHRYGQKAIDFCLFHASCYFGLICTPVFCISMHFKFLFILHYMPYTQVSRFLRILIDGLIYLLVTVCLIHRTCRTHAGKQTLSSRQRDSTENTSAGYLYYPNERFQLVDVELQVHAVCQPGADDIHRAGVPLLQERQDFSSNHGSAAPQPAHGYTNPPRQPGCAWDGADAEGQTGALSYTEFPRVCC